MEGLALAVISQFAEGNTKQLSVIMRVHMFKIAY
jgi:hypothetical protein